MNKFTTQLISIRWNYFGFFIEAEANASKLYVTVMRLGHSMDLLL
jgi:hypothetical protein